MASTTGNFETVLVHELGHVIGLGDIPGAAPCSTHQNVHSVMNGCTGKPLLANARWFPTSWDKDCADAFSWGRAVNYRWRGWTSTGANGLTELGTATYGRGTFAAGYGRTDSGAARYVLYGDDRFRSGGMNTDGNINWPTTSIMDSTELSKGIGHLDESPLLVALHEQSAGSDPMRLFFLDDEDDSSPSTKYNPPLVESVETDAELDPAVGNDAPLTRCTNAACTGEANVRSHLPLASTWDPLTETTIVVWVETYSQGSADADGTMWIHSGFDDHDVLRAGTELTSSVLDTPASSTAWDWVGKTLHTPAVACSDGTYPFGYYNCILAWVDRGLADASGNTIAWTYFKANANGTFTFYPVSYSQSLFQAGSTPALAWFADRFWLAFRTVGTTTSGGVRVFTKNNGGDWVYHSYTGATELVDAPTFIYRDGYESAAVWTESE